jgi:hypothetical protein
MFMKCCYSMSVWPCITSTTLLATNKMQQRFRLLIFLNQPYMFRATNSPILRSTFDGIYSCWYSAPTLLPTGATVWHRSAALWVHCTKSCIYSQKCSWGWANMSLETCRADLKRLINEKVVASYWLLTSLLFFFFFLRARRLMLRMHLSLRLIVQP